MRRCPKCNRTYQTDTQKFCTHDGGLLFDFDPDLKETVQFDSNKIRDAVAKPTTRDLDAQLPAQFDPEATIVTPAGDPEATFISSGRDDQTVQVKGRDTKDLEPLPTQHQIRPPEAATSGPIAPPSGPIAPPQQTSAPLSPPAPSGPIAPAQQTSAPLPPPAASSGPIALPSGPIPQPPQAQAAVAAHPSQPLPLAAAAPKKKSKLPLILGLLALLLVLFVGAVVVVGYFVWFKPARERVAITKPSQPPSSLPTPATPGDASNPSSEPPPYTPPADAMLYTNSSVNPSKALADHYVDFSFYFPKGWEADSKSGVGDSPNFIEVHRQLPPNFTQESMAVSWYDSKGSIAADRSSFPSFVEKKSSEFAKSIDQYRKTSEGPTKVGSYEGHEFRFEGLSQNTERGQFKIWGRVIWLPPPAGGKTGVTLLMLATSLAPELTSVDDVGVKGELPMLLESFRFGTHDFGR
ncbi:MAG TPA: hypothetical protein VJT71_14360 [Pyrinomonadaceae bacterium]|nr:hypothetical protein [Pyrinomonadaceae bacterium]